MKKIITFLTVMLAPFFLGIGIQAHSVVADTNEPVGQATRVQDNHNYLDKFISVRDNQFIILPEASSTLPANVYAELTAQIKSVNDSITNNNASINPETKEIIGLQTVNRPISLRADNLWAKAYNILYNQDKANFWWGYRYYFSSNQQVTNYAWAWRRTSGIGSPSRGLTDMPYIPNDLEWYNNKHRNSRIYMDINAASGADSFGTY